MSGKRKACAEDEVTATLGMPLKAAQNVLDELAAQIPAARRIIDMAKAAAARADGKKKEKRTDQLHNGILQSADAVSFATKTRKIMTGANFNDVRPSAIAMRHLIREASVISAVDPAAAFQALENIRSEAVRCLPKGRGIHGNPVFFELWSYAPLNDRPCFNLVKDLRDAMFAVADKNPEAVARQRGMATVFTEACGSESDVEDSILEEVKGEVESDLEPLHGDDGFADDGSEYGGEEWAEEDDEYNE